MAAPYDQEGGDTRSVAPAVSPPPADERTLREIFVQLSRINERMGKFKTLDGEIDALRKDVTSLQKEVVEMKLEEAKRSGTRGTLMVILTTVAPFLCALFGAAAYKWFN
jgi:hypothetical protein